MLVYLIRESVEPAQEFRQEQGAQPFAAVMSREEWEANKDHFGMGIDMEMDLTSIRDTRAVVNYDSLTGTIAVPELSSSAEGKQQLAFALDERGVIFIDEGSFAADIIEQIGKTKRWQEPSLERFLYEFFERIILKDPPMLEEMEQQLDETERKVLAGEIEEYPAQLAQMRADLLDLRMYYEQLIDLGQELEENENGFFNEDNLRYFRLFTARVQRLQDSVTSLRETISQIRELIQSELTVRQNKIMTWLTVVTSIFMPLTLITGWYGMNFRYMPELLWKLGYPGVLVLCIAIAVALILFFKKRKWL